VAAAGEREFIKESSFKRKRKMGSTRVPLQNDSELYVEQPSVQLYYILCFIVHLNLVLDVM